MGDQGVVTVDTTEDERICHVLDDHDLVELARWAVAIEDHYQPMDLEWAKDGADGTLWVVQARPETVQARKKPSTLRSYHLSEPGEGLVSGLAIGDAIAAGKVCTLTGPEEIDRFQDGSCRPPFSIGSNDLTQLTLGVERDSERLAGLFDECDPAVTRSIETVIGAAHRRNRKVGLCGQRPSDDRASRACWSAPESTLCRSRRTASSLSKFRSRPPSGNWTGC